MILTFIIWTIALARAVDVRSSNPDRISRIYFGRWTSSTWICRRKSNVSHSHRRLFFSWLNSSSLFPVSLGGWATFSAPLLFASPPPSLCPITFRKRRMFFPMLLGFVPSTSDEEPQPSIGRSWLSVMVAKRKRAVESGVWQSKARGRDPEHAFSRSIKLMSYESCVMNKIGISVKFILVDKKMTALHTVVDTQKYVL